MGIASIIVVHNAVLTIINYFMLYFFVLEPPEFITKPKSQSATVGQDIFLECQARGDPHPAVVWTKKDLDEENSREIDLNRATVVHGKGLRIENARVGDAGIYTCAATNAAGSVKVSATLKVSQPPRIVAAPQASMQIVAGHKKRSNVTLRCSVVGVPSPVVLWSREEEGQKHRFMFPGGVYDGVVVRSNGDLIIAEPNPGADSGHFDCLATNSAGSSLSRSHLLVYDPSDFEDHPDRYASHGNEDYQAEALRSKLSEPNLVKLNSAKAIGPGSVKLSWTVSRSAEDDVSGFRIWYKPILLPDQEYRHVDVAHPEVRTFVVTRLNEFTSYDFFVQPFGSLVRRQISGSLSNLAEATTHQDAPSAAPEILEARLVNASTIFLAWRGPSLDESNGQLTGYQVKHFPLRKTFFLRILFWVEVGKRLRGWITRDLSI